METQNPYQPGWLERQNEFINIYTLIEKNADYIESGSSRVLHLTRKYVLLPSSTQRTR